MRLPLLASVLLLAATAVGCGAAQPSASTVGGTPTPAPAATPAPTSAGTSAAGDVRADAEAACAEAYPDAFREACVENYIELADRGATMTPANADAYGFPFRVCIWPDGRWTLSDRTLSGTLPIGSVGCGSDGKGKVTAIIEGP